MLRIWFKIELHVRIIYFWGISIYYTIIIHVLTPSVFEDWKVETNYYFIYQF